jgi:hypothetical protein
MGAEQALILAPGQLDASSGVHFRLGQTKHFSDIQGKTERPVAFPPVNRLGSVMGRNFSLGSTMLSSC